VLIAICAFGVVAGVALERSVLRQRSENREAFRGRVPVWARSESEHRVYWGRVAKRLELTPAQAAAVDTILAQRSRQLEAARAEVEPLMKEIMTVTRRQIDSVLTADQRERFQELRRQRRLKHGRP
jgi:Spy/CpxP family protein refolding chaperone